MAALHRRTGITTVATLCALALAVVLTHAVAPEWSRTIGLDVWNTPSYEAECQSNMIRAQDLDDFRERLNRHIELSDEIARQWIAGEISLRQAIDQLQEIEPIRPGFEEILENAWPDANPKERLGEYLLIKARRQLGANPSFARGAMCRLEAEVRETNWSAFDRE